MILSELDSRQEIHGETDDPVQMDSLITVSRPDDYSYSIKLNDGIRPRDGNDSFCDLPGSSVTARTLSF
jgi:hypothetical protein